MPALPPDACAGLFGKLPARGDFVRENLPRDFTDLWDAWWQRGLADTQRRPREEWCAAWLEAPVWRFMLPPGLCGRNGVLGLWLPSVDKVGRYSPLTIAAAAPGDRARSARRRADEASSDRAATAASCPARASVDGAPSGGAAERRDDLRDARARWRCAARSRG